MTDFAPRENSWRTSAMDLFWFGLRITTGLLTPTVKIRRVQFPTWGTVDGAQVAADKQTPRVRFTAATAMSGLADVQFQAGARLSLSHETGVLGWDPGGGGHSAAIRYPTPGTVSTA